MLAFALATSASAMAGCGGEEQIGVAQEDSLIANTRQIVSSTSADAQTQSAAWNAASVCKQDSVVIAWEVPTLAAGSWATNCVNGPFGLWVRQQATTTNWGTLTDVRGKAASYYGKSVTVVGVPNRTNQFAILTLMHTTDGLDDVAIATSVDGGKSFQAKAVLNTGLSVPDIGQPFLVADPSRSDGTLYAAWQNHDDGKLYFQEVLVTSTGGVNPLSQYSTPLQNALGTNVPFTMAVQTGSSPAVWIAYADQFGPTSSTDCAKPATTRKWWAGSTTNAGASWTWQMSPIDSDPNWKWCVGNQPSAPYGNSTRPELVYAPSLNQLAVAYARTDPDNYNRVYVATFTPGGSGWTIDKPADQGGNFDRFRPAFASSTASTQAFGLSYLTSDYNLGGAGHVTANIATSTDGAVHWSTSQVSASSWQFFPPSPISGDYAGMAVVGHSNDFWPTWTAGSSLTDVIATAEWSTP